MKIPQILLGMATKSFTTKQTFTPPIMCSRGGSSQKNCLHIITEKESPQKLHSVGRLGVIRNRILA